MDSTHAPISDASLPTYALADALAVPQPLEVSSMVPAARCGECHGVIESEWRDSAHARADSSPLYQALRTRSGSAACDRCHAPLRSLAPRDSVVAEGVSCDVCHTIQRVDLTKKDGTGFVSHPEENVRYGPLCDSRPHYFHRMGCSELIAESAFCAACHNWQLSHPAGATLSLLPDYEEWLAAPQPMGGVDCQNCHMPSRSGEAAVGSTERVVHGHDFSLRGPLLGRALEGKAQLSVGQGLLRVRLSLSNTGAGHSVPTGFPERHLYVGVRVLDNTGRVVAESAHSYGRTLADDQGRVVPFYAATQVKSDTRIRAGETREDQFELAAPASGHVEIFVRRRAITPQLAQLLGIPPPPFQPMLAGQVSLPLPLSKGGFALALKPAS